MPGHSATYLEQENLNKDLDVRKTRKDQFCDICRGGIDSHSPRTLRIHIEMQLSTTAYDNTKNQNSYLVHLGRIVKAYTKMYNRGMGYWSVTLNETVLIVVYKS